MTKRHERARLVAIGRRAVCFGLLLFAAPGQATTEAAPTDLVRVLEALGRTPHAQARFVERRHMAILDAPLASNGTLAFEAPGRLEKHVLKPTEARYVVAGNVLTVEQPDNEGRRSYALSQHPVLWGFVEAFRATLAGDLKTLQQFYMVTFLGAPSRWQLTLDPLHADMQKLVARIHIRGTHAAIDTIEVIERGGDRSVMTITRP